MYQVINKRVEAYHIKLILTTLLDELVRFLSTVFFRFGAISQADFNLLFGGRPFLLTGVGLRMGWFRLSLMELLVCGVSI